MAEVKWRNDGGWDLVWEVSGVEWENDDEALFAVIRWLREHWNGGSKKDGSGGSGGLPVAMDFGDAVMMVLDVAYVNWVDDYELEKESGKGDAWVIVEGM